MGSLTKSTAGILKHIGAFDSSRKGIRGEFKDIAGRGKGMSKQQKRDFRSREKTKSAHTPLTSTYS